MQGQAQLQGSSLHSAQRSEESESGEGGTLWI